MIPGVWCRVGAVFGLPASSFSAGLKGPWHAHDELLEEATQDALPT
jgi:hypothetical protein